VDIKQEDLIRFWTYFGWVYDPNKEVEPRGGYIFKGIWLSSDKQQHLTLPDFTLDNIFKYAIPKLQDKGYSVELRAYENIKRFGCFIKDSQGKLGSNYLADTRADNPTEALYKAIMEVINANNTKGL